ncbi:unnamed protein product [Ixodes pacificus]
MYALVRFVTDDGNQRKHMVPVSDIYDFHPRNYTDFVKKTTYKCFWSDPVDDLNTGHYTIQILLLAETEEQLKEIASQKRMPVPRLNGSDLDSEDDAECSTQREKQKDRKKKKNNEALAKKRQFDSILSQHLTHAKKIMKPTSKAPEQKKPRPIVHTSDSDNDDEVVPSAEARMQVKLAKKNANFWQMRFMQSEKEKATLREQIAYLQKKIG